MGSIRTSIQMYDGVTATLQKITDNVSKTTQQFDNMNRNFQGAFSDARLNVAKNGFDRISATTNEIENNINQNTISQQRFNTSLNSGSNAGNNLLGKIRAIAATYLSLQAAKKVLNASDELSQTTARLNLIKEETQSIAEFQMDIFNSAERARGSYTDTAAIISRLGIMAGKAFNNNDEIIAFTELMNKNFKVGGASAAEQASAMYQLSQAMASGKLQGDEYRSIIENAPLLAKSIEDYMINVQKAEGTMKDWASEGMLTANVIKAAMFRSANEVEERFKTIPLTWADIGTSIKNNVLIAFQPILKRINELANSNKFQEFKNNLIDGFQVMANVAMDLFNVLVSIVNFFSSNWTIISPIIWGIVAALLAYNAALIANNIVQAVHNIQKGIAVAAEYNHAKAILANKMAYDAETIATAQATVAQASFNTVLLACPLTWIVLTIIAIIAIFYAAIGVINKLAGTSISATGIIAGSFLWLAALIGNLFIGTINAIIQFLWMRFVEPFIGIIEWVLNVANGGFNGFGGAVANLIGQIISWFLSLGKVVTKIIDAIFGTNWTSSLSSLQDNVLAWGKNKNAITLDRNAPEIDRFDMTDAFGKGYDWGAKLFDDENNKNNDKSTDENLYDYSDMYNNIADTADNTGKMAKGIKISDEDLKYLHDVAEREAINRFTTAEIKVEMTNNNSINGTRDVDGIVDYLRDEVEEAMSSSAEGV